MRAFSYWLCFSLAALATIYTHGTWALSLAGVQTPYIGPLSILRPFGTLVPVQLLPYVPRLVVVTLGLVLFALVVRRLWVLVVQREVSLPHSFGGIARALAFVGAASWVLSAAALLLSSLLQLGSGVVAGMLALPAIYCIPWAVFLTEILSLRRRRAIEN